MDIASTTEQWTERTWRPMCECFSAFECGAFLLVRTLTENLLAHQCIPVVRAHYVTQSWSSK